MAFARVGSLGSTNDKSAGTTIVLTATATAEVGNLVVVFSAWNNEGTSEAETSQLSLTDSAGNTWTKIKEYTMSSGAADDGVTVAMWCSKITSQIDSGSDTFTVTSTSSRTASTIAAEEFTMGSGAITWEGGSAGTYYQVDGGAVADPASMSISGMTSREYLLLHVNGEERGATRTADADYTEMFDAVETTGGGAATNISLWASYRIATLTGDTVDMASATDGDYAQILAALYEASGTAYTLDCQPGSFTITGFAAGVPTVALLDAQDGAIAITGADATLSRGYNLNAEPGSFLIEDAESVGGGTATPTLDAVLGTNTDNTLTTSDDAAASTRINLWLFWYGAETLSSVADDGEGLTWDIVTQDSAFGGQNAALASAWAPDGLASGTTITATYSDPPDFGSGMAAESWLGLRESSYIEDIATPSEDFAEAWTSGDLTITLPSLLMAFSTANGGTSNTPGDTEVHDWDPEGANDGAVVYRNETDADTYTVGGTWSTSVGFQHGIAVAFKAAEGGDPTTGATLETVAQINAAPGSYTITGVAATIGREIALNAEAGSFTITGSAAGLPTVAQIDAQPGSFTITGVAAATMRSTDLNAQPGSFSITGAAATLPTVAAVDAQPGSFAVTGVAAGLPTVAALHAVPGVYVITGVDAELAFDGGAGTAYTLDAEPGSFVITGAPATLATVAALDAQPGSLAITGLDALLSAGRTVNAEPGVFAITGVAASLAGELMLDAQPGVFTISGFDVGLALAGMPQLPLVGDIVLVSATGDVRVVSAESQIIVVPLEGDVTQVDAEGEIIVITPEGDIWRL